MPKQKEFFFENIPLTSKRKPKTTGTDHRGKKFHNSVFQNFLYNNKIKHYSRNSSLGAVFAERFNRTIRDLHKKLVFERGDTIFGFIYHQQKRNNVKIEPSLLFNTNSG